MKTREKLLISGVIILLIFQFFPDYTGKWVCFALATWLLAIFYLIGGYWLLNTKNHDKSLLPIISGIAFAASLLVLPHAIRVHKTPLFKILPLANIALCIGLSIFLIIRRKQKENKSYYKLLFIRSFIILFLVSFFTYVPISFKPYRSILLAINNGNTNLMSNILMFEYTYKFEDAYANGDCDLAIENAEIANSEGEGWLGIATEEDKEKNGFLLHKISGTYRNLFDAYKCKADDLYDLNQYEQALTYYIKADEVLNYGLLEGEYWDFEQSYSFTHMALCYRNMNQYEAADSLFVKSIEKFKATTDKEDENLASIYKDLAKSQLQQENYEFANTFFNASIGILQNDSLQEKSNSVLIDNYHGLMNSYIKTDSLAQLKHYIDEAYKWDDQTTARICITKMNHGVYHYKTNQFDTAKEVLSDCLDCYTNMLNATHQNIAEVHYLLAYMNIITAQYDTANRHLKKGIEITLTNFDQRSTKYAAYQKLEAIINQLTGNYQKAEAQYNEVLETYNTAFGTLNTVAPELLATLAELELTLGKLDDAKSHSSEAFTMANKIFPMDRPQATAFINKIAYVNYYTGDHEVANTLYHKSLNTNKNYGIKQSPTTANALNGLGLIDSDQGNYKKADSLFTLSIKQYKTIFKEQHPSLATAYLNYAHLKIKEHKLDQAQKLLDQCNDINKKYYKNDHDVFADIQVAYGDLAIKQHQKEQAKSHYQKALELYTHKFSSDHLLTLNTLQKLNAL